MAIWVASGPCLSEESTWLDYEARIQYAFYTEDTRALNALMETLAARQDADAQRQYYLALASYRLAQLPAASESLRSMAAEQCTASLDRILDKQPEQVESLALQAACLTTVSQLKPLRAPLAAARARSISAQAMRLAPANPRALLIEAGQAPSAAEKSLRRAVAAFEAERQGVPRAPGWGAADAYLALGRLCLERGDVLGSRDALERALLIAPEFIAARKLLARVTSG